MKINTNTVVYKICFGMEDGFEDHELEGPSYIWQGIIGDLDYGDVAFTTKKEAQQFFVKKVGRKGKIKKY